MKKNSFLLLLCLLVCWGCYDDLGQIGSGIQPEDDLIVVYADTFTFSARTIQTDSVYVRSSISLLGEVYDPFYGSIKSSYLCQFYSPPQNQPFPSIVINDKIDSVTLKIVFPSWIGDSLTMMQAAVYPVKDDNPLSLQTYTHININDYVDLNNPSWIAKKSYTAHNTAIPDSLQRQLFIRLPDFIGETFYNASKKSEAEGNPFVNQSKFNEFFPGLHVRTIGGIGNILNISKTLLNFHYKTTITNEDGSKTDTTVVTSFSATSEVIQLNKVENYDLDQLLNDKTAAYLKTPAGVYTVVGVPVKSIKEESKGQLLNNVTFNIKTYPREIKDGYKLSAPPYLLMLPKDSMIGFFEKKSLTDSEASFIAPFDSTQLTYNFGNISAFIKNRYAVNPNKDTVEVALIPVTLANESNGTVTSINNYMIPSTAAIRLDSIFTEIRVVSSNL